MAETASPPRLSPHPMAFRTVAFLGGGLGLLLAGTLALWVHYGTAVFFEMIRTGFVACF
jgi:hypothetical protein